MHPLLDRLKAKFPDTVLSVDDHGPRAELSAGVAADRILDVMTFLHDDPGSAFDHITDVCSADYPEDHERFEVIYHLLSLPHRTRIRIKARVTEDDPRIASVTGIWKGANFMEREVYDLMGIRFTGHPDLRRILMPEDYDEGYPLRKDFPVEGKGWRATFPFLPRLDEPPQALTEGEVPLDQQRPFLLETDGIGEAGKPVRRETELLL